MVQFFAPNLVRKNGPEVVSKMQKTTDLTLGRKDGDPVASPCGCKSGGLPLTRVAHTGRSAMQAKGCQPRNLKLKRPMIVKPFSFDF